ncbi:MAG TPA: hypothetical protein VIF09_16480, partial [Polyangiaceae bacterium]
MTTPGEPPDAPEEEAPRRPLALQLELPAERLPAPGTPDRTTRGTTRDLRRMRRWVVRIAVLVVALLAAGAACVIFLLPWYVRRECIAEAA